MANDMLRLSVTNGFVLTFALLFAVCGESGGIAVLLCALTHELAHAAAVRICGGRVTAFVMEASGFQMKTVFPAGISYWKEIFCLASGALCNLLLGFALVRMVWGNEYIYMLGGANLTFGFFNLIPAGRFDGGKIVRLCAEYAAGPQRSRLIPNWISGIAAGLVLAGGGILFFKSGRNPLVALTCLYLSFLLGYDIITAVRKRR